jgi:hypothetical protein
MIMKKRIGIVIIATNSYFVLGLRFINKFNHYYKGDCEITFYFFSDTDPRYYLPDSNNIQYRETQHSDWVEGVGSKFSNILSLSRCDQDYLFYFDADTNIDRDFDEEWFIGDLVGYEHYGNNDWMKDNKAYERNPISSCYIPHNTKLNQIYYGSCLFGGLKNEMIQMCIVLRRNQLEDKKINYEPGVNDESYVNHYFHYNPPSHIILSPNYKFAVSCKGGIGETRNPELSVENYKKTILENPGRLFDIQNGALFFI